MPSHYKRSVNGNITVLSHHINYHFLGTYWFRKQLFASISWLLSDPSGPLTICLLYFMITLPWTCCVACSHPSFHPRHQKREPDSECAERERWACSQDLSEPVGWTAANSRCQQRQLICRSLEQGIEQILSWPRPNSFIHSKSTNVIIWQKK